VGGNDELIFDGGSFTVDAHGRVQNKLALFEPAFEVVDLPEDSGSLDEADSDDPDAIAQLESGLILGIRDYFRKQGLPPARWWVYRVVWTRRSPRTWLSRRSDRIASSASRCRDPFRRITA